jgi:branched-chain amino acid aminotransferase
MKVWFDGRIGAAEECRVSILDHGLLYGDGVFEGIRITGGCIFRLHDHLERLSRSARAIGLNLPYETAEIADIVCQTARAHGEAEAYVRLLVTRGIGALTLDPSDCTEPRLYCIVATLRMFPPDVRERGLSMMTAAQRRPQSDVLDPQVKSLNYLNNVLAKRDARQRGYDDALLLNSTGRVAEASGANVFAVIDGELVTPATSEGALPGITRRTLLECAAAAGRRATERPLTRYELLAAQEAFVCGSGAGLTAIGKLDDCVIGDGRRPLLDMLTKAYADYALEHGTGFRLDSRAAPS